MMSLVSTAIEPSRMAARASAMRGTDGRSEWRRAAAGVAGPLLIVLSVLVVMHRIAFGGRLSSQHPDVLAFWLPTFCFLGRSVAAGHVPAWNPFAMGGVPFAADPQSGWAYLPAMALFGALRCDLAMRWMVVVQPVLGGLGVFGFLRSERASRPAATVGGLSLALGLAGSRLGLFLPFPSSFAWIALTLAAASRYTRAPSGRRRLLWCLVTALGWGQLAGAYFAQSLVLGTVAVFVVLAATARAERWPVMTTVSRSGLLLVALPLVNLAVLLPRLAYLPRTSFGSGIAPLAQGGGLPAAWPLGLATAPGLALGAVALGLAFAALFRGRHRTLARAFFLFGLACYLVSLRQTVKLLTPLLLHVPLLRFCVHYPARFGLGVVLALPVLAGLGLDAWREAGSWRMRALMAAPGVALWFVLPPILGAGGNQMVLPRAGAVAASAAVATAVRRPALAFAVPVLLAAELTVGGLAGQTPHAFGLAGAAALDPFGAKATGWFGPLAKPNVDASAYVALDPLVRALRAGGAVRYLSIDPTLATRRGYLSAQAPADWALEANQRGMLFGLQDVQGYNPLQLSRYWMFVRAVNPGPLDYTAATFPRLSTAVSELLQVGFVVIRSGQAPTPSGPPAATAGAYEVDAVPWVPRAQVVPSWILAPSPAQALAEVLRGDLELSDQVVVERDPGIPSASPVPGGFGIAGTADYRQRSDGSASVSVDAARASLVLVRTPFDPDWRATVDGRAAPVLRADYLDQAVPVPAGRHVILLNYDDPWIGYGVLGSIVVVTLLLGAAWVAGRRRDAGAT